MRAIIALSMLVACKDAQLEKAQASFDRYRRPDLVMTALALKPGDAVADVGAGRGYLTHRLAAAVGARGRVVATDVDFAALQQIGPTRAGEAAIELRKVPPDEPSLEPRAYDLILLSEVDHLLPDRAAWLRRAAAALKPGGRIAVVNRRPFHAALVRAAADAGMRVTAERDEIPAYFVVFLEVT
jgi:predicted methyltransferase